MDLVSTENKCDNYFFSHLSFHVGSIPLHDHGSVLGYFVGQSRKDFGCLEGLPSRQGLDWSLEHDIIMLANAHRNWNLGALEFEPFNTVEQ